jgi:hypothetical protein
MKINKKEFCEHINYFVKLNKYKLEDLDLSEFGLNLTKNEIQEWHFTGLDTKSLLKIYTYTDDEGYYIENN